MGHKYYLIISLLLLSNCYMVDKVSFKTPVDTKTKKIAFQEKKTYCINETEVYISNQFEGARLNGVKKVNDSIIKIFIKPENRPINNSAYYAFKVWSKQPKNVYVVFDYPKEFEHRYFPKIKTTTTNWSKMQLKNTFKNKDIFSIRLQVSTDTVWVAAQEIMTSEDTKMWYQKLITNKNYVHLKSIGKSKLGKNLPVLDIYRETKKNKPIVVLLTRQHPPEVTGFFAFQEFLTTVLKENKLTSSFLNTYRVLAFPIVNPDGVDLGHWRHNAGGVDTNRDWSVYEQPEIKNLVKFLTKITKKDKGQIILGMDFHSTYKDVFYTNATRKNTKLPTFIEDWFIALENNIPNYKVNEAMSNSAKPVSKGWFLYGKNAVGITYEIGDETPRDKIRLVGRVTAEEMMKILLKTKFIE